MGMDAKMESKSMSDILKGVRAAARCDWTGQLAAGPSSVSLRAVLESVGLVA